MFRKTIVFTVFLLASVFLFAQNEILHGEWKLIENEVKGEALVLENGLWRDCVKNQKTIKFSNDQLIFFKDELETIAKIEIKGNELYLYFGNSDKKSYTIYQFQVTSNALTLYREDPAVSEQYVFEKLN